MSTSSFWHRGISMACLGVFSLFLMTAATGCNNCCMRKGGDNQTQAGFAKCGAQCGATCGAAKCGATCGKAKATTTTGATTASGNKTCPISGKPVMAGVTASYGDKTVGFCCGGCVGRWNAMTDADKTSKLSGA